MVAAAATAVRTLVWSDCAAPGGRTIPDIDHVDRRSRPDGHVARIPHRLRRARRRLAAAGVRADGLRCAPRGATRTTTWPEPGPRAWRSSSRSARFRARCSRSSSACSGRSSCARGRVIGLPFSLEGFAFFIEAIFLGIYLYGWDRLTPLQHWLCSLPIAICGRAFGGIRHAVNAWMNIPAGFRVVRGAASTSVPLAAMFNPAMATEVAHTTLSAYVFDGLRAAAVYGVTLLRARRQSLARDGHARRDAARGVAIPLQLVVGDLAARFDAQRSPSNWLRWRGNSRPSAARRSRSADLPDAAAHDALRDPHPVSLSVLAASRSARGGSRARRVPGRRPAVVARCTLLRHDGRLRVAPLRPRVRGGRRRAAASAAAARGCSPAIVARVPSPSSRWKRAGW